MLDFPRSSHIYTCICMSLTHSPVNHYMYMYMQGIYMYTYMYVHVCTFMSHVTNHTSIPGALIVSSVW